ncbi:hypothetical protein MAR_022250 [Mya arenaria]|uniref:Gem-associated protein 5 RBS domain-containing protein n=1 Tax=Mya arenaria TaxID=6604 RepID=A0ABY7DMC8_MYAAR|nr:hypothetical protein MAR_022250 [Mya arenaria]
MFNRLTVYYCKRALDMDLQVLLVFTDFILDPSEVDSMSPWQMHLIEGHTFPHHVLRIWYSRFDVAMDTTSIEDMYKTLCLLHAGRQAQAEQNLVLIQVCTDLTLCMLSLMMSETPTAMSHLLQAVGSLHEAGHLHIMQGVLRLFLPQGPKYILKLQQEVTAMRVMISMDTQTHVDGASKVHTIKRYLSKHKDESVINNSSLRCRELDCLRAYYYVTILTFLRESCYSGDLTASDFCQEQNPSGLQPIEKFKDKSCVNVTEGNEALLETDGKVSQSKSENSITDSIDSCITAQSLETNENTMKSSEEKANPVESASEKIDCDTKVEASNHANEKVDTENTASNEKSPTPTSSCGVKSKESSPSALPDKTSSLKKHSRCQNIPVLNVNHYSINVSRLSRLAQGVLWDLQAKRFALTETLGYIHKAISQLLLSKHSQSTTTGNESEMGASEAQPDNSDMQNPSSESNTNSKPAGSKSNRHSENSASTADSSQTARTSEPMAAGGDEGAVAMATELATKSETPTSAGPMGGLSMDTEIHICEHHEHHAQNLHVEGHLCHSVLSHHFDQMLNIHVPHVGEVSVGEVLSETENELKCSFFEVCSSCELLQKSRKILFEDEPHCHTRGEYKDMTNMTNPAKYINVPDEWYGMPVDQKYFKRYITMAILKDEQEYVMGELKRGPDSTQAPFPNPLESVKTLLDVASHSSHISRVERQQFAQKVISWALNFACTTQQKQTFLTLLQSHLEN